jgi:hypothetical protein
MLDEGFTKVLSRGYLRDVTVTGELFAKILVRGYLRDGINACWGGAEVVTN